MRRPSLSSHQAELHALRAAGMRADPTPSEAALWQLIRSRQLGVEFRRQVCIGRFIADFACAEARLVVEVDGGSHRGRERADARRDRELSRLGYRVLHLDAALVLRAPEASIARIRAALAPAREPCLRLACREASSNPGLPHPTRARSGGGDARGARGGR